MYDLVVKCFQPGTSGADADNIPKKVVKFDPVADLERFIHRNNCTAEKIPDDILGGKGKGNSCYPGTREEWCNINIEICQDQEEATNQIRYLVAISSIGRSRSSKSVSVFAATTVPYVRNRVYENDETIHAPIRMKNAFTY